ncbi:MAG: dihydroorotase [Actinobacteria bacterium]|nr:dihydroorotase [Actinomycetota bacterium]MCL5445539.1 dihydroorotase [Actinomycetota bacterium]
MAEGPLTLCVMGGTLVDSTGVRRGDVCITAGVIVEVGADLEPPAGSTVLDASGCLVTPGLVDLHTHLRQPGAEEAETVETGSRAAALGGYTAVVAMPNTDPPVDNGAVVAEVLELSKSALVEVGVAGAITVGRAGERLSLMRELAALGVKLFTDDGNGVQDGGLMRRACEYAAGLGVTLAQHCEDERIAGYGVMNEGVWSSKLGLRGTPAAAEDTMVARDISLARLTGAKVHFMHLSCASSVELVRLAKAEGLSVTAEVTPHHMVLTDDLVRDYDPVFKVNPPLRGVDDVAAIRRGLRDGTIDAIATDHAPHSPESKQLPFDDAPPGMIGLQTALAVSYDTLLSNENHPSFSQLQEFFALFTSRPARIAGLSAQGGPLSKGSIANICVFDPDERWTVESDSQASRSRNTPFAGRSLKGRVRHCILRGEPTVVDAVALR